MKKLALSVVVMLTMGLFLGCGTDVEDCLDAFFEEYYKECVQLCEMCAEWVANCGITNYSMSVCVEERWRYGSSPGECQSERKRVAGFISTSTCSTDELDWKCLDYQ